MLIKKMNYSESCLFQSPDTTPALTVAASNALDASYPIMNNFSVSMSSTILTVSSIRTKKLIFNFIGVRMRKTLKNSLMKSKRKMKSTFPS